MDKVNRITSLTMASGGTATMYLKKSFADVPAQLIKYANSLYALGIALAIITYYYYIFIAIYVLYVQPY